MVQFTVKNGATPLPRRRVSGNEDELSNRTCTQTPSVIIFCMLSRLCDVVNGRDEAPTQALMNPSRQTKRSIRSFDASMMERRTTQSFCLLRHAASAAGPCSAPGENKIRAVQIQVFSVCSSGRKIEP